VIESIRLSAIDLIVEYGVAKVAGDMWEKAWGEGKKIVEILRNCRPAPV
jgi:hypothetical protein